LQIVDKRSSGSGKQEPSINQGPYLNIAEDGLVAAVKYEQDTNKTTLKQRGRKPEEDVTKKSFKELCRQTKQSVWWLGYIGMVTSFPLLGMLLNYIFRKKQRPTTTSTSWSCFLSQHLHSLILLSVNLFSIIENVNNHL